MSHNVPTQQIYNGVLIGLVAGTLLTVGASLVDLGHAGNVLVGLGIAVVKASLVCAFFMQLKYEERWWTGLVLFCVVLVGIIVGVNLVDTGLNGPVHHAYKVEKHGDKDVKVYPPVTAEENEYGLTTPAVVWCSRGPKPHALAVGVLDCTEHAGAAAHH